MLWNEESEIKEFVAESLKLESKPELIVAVGVLNIFMNLENFLPMLEKIRENRNGNSGNNAMFLGKYQRYCS